MPSNRELISEAKTLGEELGVEVDTARKNNRQLEELVESLRAQRDGVSGEQPAPREAPEGVEFESAPAPPQEALPGLVSEQPAASAPSSPPPAPTAMPQSPAPSSPPPGRGNRFRYVIAPGKCLTSPRGVLSGGSEIRESDVSGGKRQIERLMELGYVVCE